MTGSSNGGSEITAVLGTQSVAAVTLEATGERTLAVIMAISLVVAVLAVTLSRLSVALRARK
jgi:molybdopterin-binding protein